ncbi:MAG: hypothetical protein EXS17_08085 [Phycisphaerales bacterium]|nr:hypothetical protein [Phycisphaerales bacterium]
MIGAHMNPRVTSRRRMGGVVVLSVGAVVALCCVGCQPKENPVLSNEQFPGEIYPSNVLLTQAQRGEVVAALRATAVGMPTDPLTKAPDAVRWSDVKAAANAAIVAAEMGLVKSTLDGETWTFEIETQGGEPAKLTVVKRAAPEMYLATATVGTFGERFDNAERIVREFRMAMRRFGALNRPS